MWGSIGMVYSRGPPRETERETAYGWRVLVFKLGIGTSSPCRAVPDMGNSDLTPQPRGYSRRAPSEVPSTPEWSTSP